jgi:hypothetical protein
MSQRPGAGNFVLGIGMVLFAVTLIYTFTIAAKVTSTSDTAQQVDAALAQIGWANGGLITLLLIIAFSYVRMYPELRDNYIFVMMHIALYVSVMAVSIAVIKTR